MQSKNIFITASICLGLMVLLINKAEAQVDAHYWTHQYGAKGLLLNGAVIATADDETNIFYNPGALSLNNGQGFAFSFLSPTYASLSAKNFLANNSSLQDAGFDFSPGFLAYSFQPVPNLTVGLASFERFKSNIRFRDRITGPINQTTAFLLRADLDFERKVSEDWFGVSLSYNIQDRLGIGISQFSVWHDQNLHYDITKEVVAILQPNNIVASWRNRFGYNFSTYSGFITKIGLSYSEDNFKMGFTYTSPMYGIVNSGISYNLDDQRLIPGADQFDVVSNRDEAELLEYRTPHSFGIGIEFTSGNICYSVSTEFFSGIERYTIFNDTDDPLDGQSPLSQDTQVSLETGNSSIVNFAFGLQFKQNENLTWLAGFRTDINEETSLVFNGLNEYLGSMPSVVHLSTGAMLRQGKNTFSFGMDIGYGTRSGGNSLASFDDVNLDNLFSFSGNNNVNTRFSSIMLFITYDFIFNRVTTNDE